MAPQLLVALLAISLVSCGSAEQPKKADSSGSEAPMKPTPPPNEQAAEDLMKSQLRHTGYIKMAGHPKATLKPLMGELRLRQQPGAVLVIRPQTHRYPVDAAPNEAMRRKPGIQIDEMDKMDVRRARGLFYIVD